MKRSNMPMNKLKRMAKAKGWTITEQNLLDARAIRTKKNRSSSGKRRVFL